MGEDFDLVGGVGEALDDAVDEVVQVKLGETCVELCALESGEV